MSRRARVIGACLLIAAVLAAGFAAVRRHDCAAFDSDRVAYLEKAGWEAYYARNWMQVFALMVQMNHTQFCMSWLDAATAAVDIARAAAAFAPVDNDVAATEEHLTRFYVKARNAAGLEAAPATLAALELDYWLVHRALAVARKAAPDHAGDITPMTVSLERLHAALFDAPPAALRRSAAARAEAAATVDRITGGYSADIAADWESIEQHLRRAYRAVADAPDTMP